MRIRRKTWTNVLLILGGLFLLYPAVAEAQKVNSIDLTTAVAEVAQKTMPAVVHIEVTQGSRSHHRSSLSRKILFPAFSLEIPQCLGLIGGRCGKSGRR